MQKSPKKSTRQQALTPTQALDLIATICQDRREDFSGRFPELSKLAADIYTIAHGSLRSGCKHADWAIQNVARYDALVKIGELPPRTTASNASA